MLRVFTVIDHDVLYVNGASVVVATDEEEARRLLDAALIEAGLRPYDKDPYTLVELDTTVPHAVVLNDGDY